MLIILIKCSWKYATKVIENVTQSIIIGPQMLSKSDNKACQQLANVIPITKRINGKMEKLKCH